MSIQTFISSIESELENFSKRIFGALALEHEYKSDLSEFGIPNSSSEESKRTARHLEWFLLERPSETLGAVPLEHFLNGLGEDQVAALASVYASLRGSRVGVFVVSRVVAKDGFLLNDFLGRGQYAVVDAELTLEFEPGDLVVGRLYPEDFEHQGERTPWGISSSAASFRSSKLTQALEADLGAMRKRIRGPLRMTQRDLEQMFFSEQVRLDAEPVAPAALDQAATEKAVRELFAEGGLAPDRVAELFLIFVSNPLPPNDTFLGDKDPLGWVLNELAFETDLELGHARHVLMNYWRAQSQVKAERDDEEEKDSLRMQRAEALKRFDAGRTAGGNLDDLFVGLEADLGVQAGPGNVVGIPDEALEEGLDGDPAPDFPGVLGALVQEFLWDGARLKGVQLDRFADQHRDLELFVQFGTFIGVAEDLASKHVELFLGRWIWEQDRLQQGGYRALGVVQSLQEFCLWLTEYHSSEVHEQVIDLFDAVAKDAARIQALGASELVTASSSNGARFFEFVEAQDGQGRWLDCLGGTFEGALPSIHEELRSGDFVAAVCLDHQLRIQTVYPAAACPYLKENS